MKVFAFALFASSAAARLAVAPECYDELGRYTPEYNTGPSFVQKQAFQDKPWVWFEKEFDGWEYQLKTSVQHHVGSATIIKNPAANTANMTVLVMAQPSWNGALAYSPAWNVEGCLLAGKDNHQETLNTSDDKWITFTQCHQAMLVPGASITLGPSSGSLFTIFFKTAPRWVPPTPAPTPTPQPTFAPGACGSSRTCDGHCPLGQTCGAWFTGTCYCR